MYLRAATLVNIRSIEYFHFVLEPDEFAGWHVFLGDNGSGKSSFIRSIAASLIGPDQIAALRQDWSLWLRRGEQSGSFDVFVDRSPDCDAITGGGTPAANYYIGAGFDLKSTETSRGTEVTAKPRKQKYSTKRYLWGSGSGWFSAAYGPYRRFAGGNQDHAKLFYSHPRLAAHLSAFGEDVALTECLEWLVSLKFKQLEAKRGGKLLDRLIEFINLSGLLPHHAYIESVSSDGVFISDGFGATIPVDELSDGFRSILSMTFELIRQLTVAYGTDDIFSTSSGKLAVRFPGVVLIDEVDVHLHPTWQRRIGNWFTAAFPKMQFIVTTHSPFVCQAAARGSIWKLPSPTNATTALSADSSRVTGDDLARLLYGDIATAHATELFGLSETRSNESSELLKELAKLNAKSLDTKLTSAEQERVRRLRVIFGNSPIG